MKHSIEKLFENTIFTIILVSIVLLVYSLVNMPRTKIDDPRNFEESRNVSYNSEIDKQIEAL